jgi:hypothetical protein
MAPAMACLVHRGPIAAAPYPLHVARGLASHYRLRAHTGKGGGREGVVPFARNQGQSPPGSARPPTVGRALLHRQSAELLGERLSDKVSRTSVAAPTRRSGAAPYRGIVGQGCRYCLWSCKVAELPLPQFFPASRVQASRRRLRARTGKKAGRKRMGYRILLRPESRAKPAGQRPTAPIGRALLQRQPAELLWKWLHHKAPRTSVAAPTRRSGAALCSLCRSMAAKFGVSDTDVGIPPTQNARSFHHGRLNKPYCTP